jgi:O-antigen ligase
MIYKIAASLYIFTTILLSHYVWGTKYNKIMAGILFALVIVERLRKKKRLLEISPQHVIFILWLLLATLAGIISNSGMEAIETSVRAFMVFLASIPLYMVIVDRHCIKWISWTLVLAAIASSATISFGILPPTRELISLRFAGTLGNANLFAFVSLIGIICLTYLWRVHHRLIIKVLILISAIYLFYQIVISGSRKGIIGVFIILWLQYVLFIFKNRKKEIFKRSVAGLVVLLIFIGSFSYFIMTSDYSHRVRNIMHYIKGEKLEKKERSIINRAYLIQIGINDFSKNPFIGTGLSSFDDTKIGIGILSRRIGAYSHSNFIEVLVSSGIIGFFLYYAIYLSCILGLLQQFKYELDPRLKPILYFASTAIPVLIFYEFFAVTYSGNEYWIFLSCVFASNTILKKNNLISLS